MRVLDGRGGEHVAIGDERLLRAVGSDDDDARHVAPAHEQLDGARLRAKLAVAREERLAEERDGGRALGVDGTPEVSAEATIVARRSPVVGLRGDRRGKRKRGVTERARDVRDLESAVHPDAGRHGIGTAARTGEGIGSREPLHADGALGVGVERLELVILHGPVREARVRHRAEEGPELEVGRREARHLQVRVHRASAHGLRDAAHVADVRAVAVALPPSGKTAVRRSGPAAGSCVAAVELQLVAREVRRRLAG